MFAGLFNNLTEKEKNDAIEKIIEHATPRKDFFLMLVLSVVMATFGVLLNSTVILIGSMLIAPLLYPILSFSLGVIAADHKLIGRSVYTIMKSIGGTLFVAFCISLLFVGRTVDALALPFAITDGTAPLIYAVVAAVSGFAAAFAITKPHLNDTLPGVAISVSLVPPLAISGVALSHFDFDLFSSAMLLFVVNIIGIAFSAMIVFALLRFSLKRSITEEVVEKEEKIVEREARQAAAASVK